MTGDSPLAATWPPQVIGLAQLAHRIFRGEDLSVLRAELEARVDANPLDAAAWLDLGVLLEVHHQKEEGLACQARALRLERVYRQPAQTAGPGLTLLMFVAPGDIAANVPVSFLLLNSDVTLDLAFLLPGEPLPDEVPDHDIAMIGACESDANTPVLEQIETFRPDWPRPFLLNTAGIQSMERDRLWQLLQGAPGISIPPTVLMTRDQVRALADGSVELPGLSETAVFPFLLRPLDSHGGHGLERVETPSDVSAYLGRHPAEKFFFAPFVDYRLADGQYRKYRVVLIDGKPFLAHMAVAAHWMLHYINAGMDADPAKREEEARAFATFDEGFAVRHGAALRALYERTGRLEYITIDCAETREGDLLIFEAGTAMVVHDMDSREMYPYKAPNMQRIFAAFRDLLERRAHS